jgi:hypothetical protein
MGESIEIKLFGIGMQLGMWRSAIVGCRNSRKATVVIGTERESEE